MGFCSLFFFGKNPLGSHGGESRFPDRPTVISFSTMNTPTPRRAAFTNVFAPPAPKDTIVMLHGLPYHIYWITIQRRWSLCPMRYPRVSDAYPKSPAPLNRVIHKQITKAPTAPVRCSWYSAPTCSGWVFVSRSRR